MSGKSPDWGVHKLQLVSHLGDYLPNGRLILASINVFIFVQANINVCNPFFLLAKSG